MQMANAEDYCLPGVACTSSPGDMDVAAVVRQALQANQSYQALVRQQLQHVRTAQLRNDFLQKRLLQLMRPNATGCSASARPISPVTQMPPNAPAAVEPVPTDSLASIKDLDIFKTLDSDLSNSIMAALSSAHDGTSLGQPTPSNGLDSTRHVGRNSNPLTPPLPSPLSRTTETKPTDSRSGPQTSSMEDRFDPYFVDINGEKPPENIDATLKARYSPIVDPAPRWTERERRALAKGVRAQNQRIIAKQLQNSEDPSHTLWDVEKIPPHLLEMNLDGLNWNEIARLHVKSRQPNECAIQWTTHDHPLINKSPWLPQETEKLQSLVSEQGPRNWPAIATSLETNRTAAQCFRKYQEILQAKTPKRKWTPEEDELLREAVQIYGEKNWQQIAYVMESRTGQQCLHRWTKSVNPVIRRGRWAPEEDEALLTAVDIYGEGNWRQVQHYVQSRTDVQCRERYCNVLHPRINQGPWTKEEDLQLLVLVQKHGIGKWSQIAIGMHKRTDNQCWRRWKMLVKHKIIDPTELSAQDRPVTDMKLNYPKGMVCDTSMPTAQSKESSVKRGELDRPVFWTGPTVGRYRRSYLRCMSNSTTSKGNTSNPSSTPETSKIVTPDVSDAPPVTGQPVPVASPSVNPQGFDAGMKLSTGHPTPEASPAELSPSIQATPDSPQLDAMSPHTTEAIVPALRALTPTPEQGQDQTNLSVDTPSSTPLVPPESPHRRSQRLARLREGKPTADGSNTQPKRRRTTSSSSEYSLRTTRRRKF
ncbi:hypothetical protein IWQ62_000201 [Dispira parvispora]|uniref:Uncharacterized protein n=1 Tax=Dispira parvispora TaxID=1520584 RepID=A0A9W8E6B9_9FUNG|nr:hypothetical protein IWQ62_000201 [Dispira parvispora]